jgi:predicted permease
MNLLDLWHDIRLAIRHLRKAPGYTTAAIVTLALAIGANSAIFGAVHAVLLKPLPIHNPDAVVIAWETDPSHDLSVVEVTYRNFERWRVGARGFQEMAVMGSSAWPAILDDEPAIGGGGVPRSTQASATRGGGDGNDNRDRAGANRPAGGNGGPGAAGAADGSGSVGAGGMKLSAMGVSASFFDTLGAPPLLGRVLGPDDDRVNAAPVVVISHGLWTRRFGGDPSVLGRTIRLNDVSTAIVGVMPAAFDFPRGTDVWKPVVPVLANTKNAEFVLERVGVLYVLGRLRDGISVERATQELDALARRVPQPLARPANVPAVRVTPLVDFMLGPVHGALWWLLAAVGALLLIACANVSGLMLTRAALQRREHAIRLALGASRAAIGRLWAIESVLLSLAGGVLGIVASYWIGAAIVALAPEDIPRLTEVTIDLPVAAFTLAIVLATALLCGLGPVLQARRSTLVDALNDAWRGSSTGVRSIRARSALVTLQIGLAVVLLIAAGLVVRSFVALRQLDLGFDPTDVVTMDVQPRLADDGLAPNVWLHELLTRVEQLPNVTAAGAVYLRPLALGRVGQDSWVLIDGQPATREAVATHPPVNSQVATPGYFRAMKIILKRGRFFNARDDGRAQRVCIIGETTARRLWPGEDPIGRQLSLPVGGDKLQNVWRTVVGIVSDVRYRGLDDVRLDVYDPALQSNQTTAHVVVRTTPGASAATAIARSSNSSARATEAVARGGAISNPIALAAAVQAEARRLDPRVVIDRVTTMEAIVERAVAPWRFSVWLFTLFATLAFALSMVGLFTVVSLDVVQRSREFAVRLALGAQRRDIVHRVLTSASARVIVGAGLGLLMSAIGSRWIGSLLFDIHPLDAATYVGVTLLVAAVVAAASYLPARRASRIDPLVLLKRD